MQGGELWNQGKRETIKWPAGTKLPVKNDWRGWTRLAKSYLQNRYGDEPWQLTIFLQILARRKSPSKKTTPIPKEAIRLLGLYNRTLAEELKSLETNDKNFKEKGGLRLINSAPSYQWKAVEKDLKRAFQRLAKCQ